MPNVTGLPALDVAIGLSFVYLVFSLAASAANEAVASFLGLRARELEKGVRNLVDDPAGQTPTGERFVEELQRHPVIGGLTKDRADHQARRPWRHAWPSYVPSTAFARAVLDTVAPATGVDDRRNVLERTHEALARLEREDAKGPGSIPPAVRRMLTGAVVDAEGDVARFRTAIEAHFDNAMDRVSGWYKRRTQLTLLVIAVAAAGALNIDSLRIANALWSDQTLRQAVVVQAQAQAQKSPTDDVRTAARDVSDVEQLKLPLGWTEPPSAHDARYDQGDPRQRPTTFSGWLLKLAGLLVTVVAVSLGAPFWFDALNRLVRLRGTGPKPKRAPAAA